ncbi:transposase [Teredinibacter haidensis]|uniref:transposase n=1 Tax=Teredinibacter haidensis TaxID=2731755 RepID=UPI0024844C15|nr:transposase [Teredinibacter haidensis]
MKHLLSKRFGSSSEKSSPDQLGLFDEAECEESGRTTVKSHSGTHTPGVSIPDNLPREEIVHDLP